MIFLKIFIFWYDWILFLIFVLTVLVPIINLIDATNEITERIIKKESSEIVSKRLNLS
jgi:hypothetical protein